MMDYTPGEYETKLLSGHKERSARLWGTAKKSYFDKPTEWPQSETIIEGSIEVEPDLEFVPMNDSDLIIMIAEKRRYFGQYHYSALDICRDVARNYQMTLTEMLSHRREKRIVHARQHAIYVLSRVTTMSLTQIASAVGGRDHTTIMHSIKKFKQRMEEKKCGRAA